jgi:hypothetical protein
VLDAEIRVAVEARLRHLHGAEPETRYRHELGLCMGETRVDVAAINGKITGCEIKGSRDKLTRLKTQVGLYDRVVDESFLVVEPRDLERAQEFVPDWWGIWVAHEVTDEEPELVEMRPAQQSPHLDAFSIAQLLWRVEGMAVLRALGKHRGMSRATRFDVWDALVEHLPLPELQREVRDRLKARQEWPGG